MSDNKIQTKLPYHKHVHRVAKNFLIPHEGNNFEPHFLRPRRLVAYATGSIAVKIIIFLFILFLPVTAWLTPDIASDQARKIIALTNEVRVNLKLNPLKENITLSEAAYNKVQDMIINQYFAHVNSKQQGLKYWLSQVNYGYAAAGENLAMGFAEPQDVVNAWQNSKTHYANIINPSFTEIGVAMESGKYNSYDTTLVAQFIALPAKSVSQTPKVATKEAIVKPVEVVISTSAPQVVLGQVIKKTVAVKKADPIVVKPAVTTTNATSTIVATTTIASSTQLVSDLTLSFVNDNENNQERRVVRAHGTLSSGVVSAEVNFSSYTLNLQRVNSTTNQWSGSMIVFGSDDKLFNPIVLPVLTVHYSDGSSKAQDIAWQNIQPVNPSVVDRYFFIKNRNSPTVNKFFSFSLIIYKILLVIAILTLFLNILFNFKKQNLKLIVVSLGFVILMVFLILV